MFSHLISGMALSEEIHAYFRICFKRPENREGTLSDLDLGRYWYPILIVFLVQSFQG